MSKKLVTLLCIAALSLVMQACGSQARAVAPLRYNPTPVGKIYTYPPLNTTMYTDTSPTFLQGDAMGGSIAQTPPTIDFGVATIDPQTYSSDYGVWGNAVRGPDGKYYWGAGDHSGTTGGFNGALLMDYDPVKKQPELAGAVCYSQVDISRPRHPPGDTPHLAGEAGTGGSLQSQLGPSVVAVLIG